MRQSITSTVVCPKKALPLPDEVKKEIKAGHHGNAFAIQNRVKKIRFFSFFSVFVLLMAASANAASMVNPLLYKDSLHSMIIAWGKNPVKQSVSVPCQMAIASHLKAGKNFFSPVLLKKYTMRIEDFADEDVKDREFFHFTNAEAVKKEINAGRLDQVFHFLRHHTADSSSWFLYMAADDRSSGSYGYVQVTIHLRPHALVFLSMGDAPGKPPTALGADQVTKDIEQDLIARDAGLAVCSKQGAVAGDYREHPILVNLATEASGIDAIAYIGIENAGVLISNIGFLDFQWMQLVGPWSISDAKAD